VLLLPRSLSKVYYILYLRKTNLANQFLKHYSLLPIPFESLHSQEFNCASYTVVRRCAMAYTVPAGVTSAEPPPERPSLAATHPQLFRQGNDILQLIMQIMSIIPTEEGIGAIVDGLPGFLDKVDDFVRDTRTTRLPTGLSRPLKLPNALNKHPVQSLGIIQFLQSPRSRLGLLLQRDRYSNRLRHRGCTRTM
jgi:hypothetical protein